jgi:hypothetical protein
MLRWLRRWRRRAERVDAKEEALTRALGVDAHYAARQRRREAENAEAAREWRAVAKAIAHKTGRRHGLDTATRMAMDADFSDRREHAAKVDQVEGLTRGARASRRRRPLGLTLNRKGTRR